MYSSCRRVTRRPHRPSRFAKETRKITGPHQEQGNKRKVRGTEGQCRRPAHPQNAGIRGWKSTRWAARRGVYSVAHPPMIPANRGDGAAREAQPEPPWRDISHDRADQSADDGVASAPSAPPAPGCDRAVRPTLERPTRANRSIARRSQPPATRQAGSSATPAGTAPDGSRSGARCSRTATVGRLLSRLHRSRPRPRRP